MIKLITNVLDLKEDQIETINIIDEEGNTSIEITLKRFGHSCPTCFKSTSDIKGYKTKKLNHQVFIHRNTCIYYKCRRYKCPHCGKTFNEDSPFGHTYSSISAATLIGVLDELKHYTATYTQVAKRFNISPSTVVKIFDNHVNIKGHLLPKVINIDEFYFNRHSKYKYAFMIMGFEDKQIIDIVESRWQQKLSSYFFSIPTEERNQVTHVCMDMYGSYKFLVPTYFPNCVLCIDSFHVIKRITDELNSLRKRIMRKYTDDKSSKEYRILKYKYKMLLKNAENINDEKYFFDKTLGYTTTQAGALQEIFNIDDRLRVAYNLKEDYRIFNEIEKKDFDREAHKKVLLTLIAAMKATNTKEMLDAAKSLSNWKEEILNSFVWFDNRRLSNGIIEGKNNYIKKILSNANGMKNFNRARNRIMYSQNLEDTYSISVSKREIRVPGKFRGTYNKKAK